LYVEVTTGPAAVSLSDEEDLTRFSVRVPEGTTAESIAGSLQAAGAGRLDGAQAAINVDWLREHTADRPAQWQGDFDKMLAYAASKGWMDAAGAVVKAHRNRLNIAMIAHRRQLSQHLVATARDRPGRVRAPSATDAGGREALRDVHALEPADVEHVRAAGTNASTAVSSRHRPHRGGVVYKLDLRMCLGRINAHID
jgi:hypothetical protein